MYMCTRLCMCIYVYVHSVEGGSLRVPVPLKRISYLEPSACAVYSEIGIFLRCLKFHEKFIRVLEHAHTYISNTHERFIVLAFFISSGITVRRLIITSVPRYTSWIVPSSFQQFIANEILLDFRILTSQLFPFIFQVNLQMAKFQLNEYFSKYNRRSVDTYWKCTEKNFAIFHNRVPQDGTCTFMFLVPRRHSYDTFQIYKLVISGGMHAAAARLAKRTNRLWNK